MEQQIKWLWLGLLISSAGWLIFKWVEFQQQVSTGQITAQSIRQSQQNQSTSKDVPSVNLLQQDDTPSLTDDTKPTDLPQLNLNVQSVSGTDNATPNNDQFVLVETDTFRGIISLKGGNLVQLKLKKYPISVKQKDIPFTLFKRGNRPYSFQSGLLSQQPAANHHAQYTSVQKNYSLQPDEPTLRIPLVWQKDGIKIIKTYVFNRDSHQIEIDQQIINNTDQNWVGASYTQLNRSRPNEDNSDTFIYTYTGSAWWSEETGFKKIDFDEMATDSPTLDTKDGWIAMIQHYFVSVIVPTENEQNHFYTKNSNTQYIIGTVSPHKTVGPHRQQNFKSILFAGPKNQKELTATHKELSYAVDYGIFHIIAAPIFWVLKHIHDLFDNWAIAIILTTVLIKLLFFKLSEKSYRSMARMKLLTPRIQKLRERYSNDKQGLNQKMMQIYKEEKVNPLGGCLPVIVQIPVFISLYWVLIESVELRQAPFILWIDDLSIADPYFVMPIIMGITMFIQQRLNPPPADPTQQKVMQFLPAIFTIFFLFFPAGLVLYWIVNNILSIAQQWYITRRIENEKRT